MSGVIHVNSIKVKYLATEGKASGLAISLWQGDPPAKVCDLTQDTGLTWQYNFPPTLQNGTYMLYKDDTPVTHDGTVETIEVQRADTIPESW